MAKKRSGGVWILLSTLAINWYEDWGVWERNGPVTVNGKFRKIK